MLDIGVEVMIWFSGFYYIYFYLEVFVIGYSYWFWYLWFLWVLIEFLVVLIMDLEFWVNVYIINELGRR